MERGYVGLTLKLRDTGKVWEPRTASGGSGCQVRSWQVTHRPQRRGSHPEEDKRGRPTLDRASLTINELCLQEEAHFQDDKRLQESQVEAELGRRDDSERKTMADTRHTPQ